MDSGGRPDEESFDFDVNGNLVEAANAHARVTRNFDADGRLIQEVQGPFTIQNSYDAAGHRIARTTSAGNTVAYALDVAGRAVSIRINEDEPIRIERDAAGRIAHEQLSPQLSRRVRYNPDGYVTEDVVSGNELPLFDTRFEYDPAGNLTRRRDSEYGSDVYRYDPLGRITEHLDPQGRIARYLNDPAGDRLMTGIVEGARDSVIGGGMVAGEWRREGEYQGTYYRFNRAGNLVERHDAQRKLLLTWDARQRLIESDTNGSATRYGYDPLGRRLFKETDGCEYCSTGDGDALAGEAVAAIETAGESTPAAGNDALVSAGGREPQAAAAQRAREYVYYPETFDPLALVECGAANQRVCHYHNDPNGCPTRLTDADGQVRWSASYSAWGQISRLHVSAIDNPIRSKGQYEDRETGLHYNRYRYFDATAGLFVSQDPLGLMAGDNLYQLAVNMWAWVDPLGLAKCKVVNSEMAHAADRAVERAGLPDPKAAREALKSFGERIEKEGLPADAVRDTIRADRWIVPGFGTGGSVVYQELKNGTLRLKTVLITR